MLIIVLIRFGISIVVAGIIFGGIQMLSKYAVLHEIKNDTVQYSLYGMRIWTCPLCDISEIKIVSVFDIFVIPTLNLICRPFGPYVILRRRGGRFKTVLLTPPDAKGFVEQVRTLIAENGAVGDKS